MGHVDVSRVSHALPDGRVLFADVGFRVGEGAKPAPIGASGTARTTLLRRYELPAQVDQRYETLSSGQRTRAQVLLLELSGCTMLLLDEPTDNLDLDSAEVLEAGLAAFGGTGLAVTHDRWFARGFDRFVVFGADGRVTERAEPIWDEGRVVRAR